MFQKKKKKDQQIETPVLTPPIDATAAALEAMMPLVDQVNTLYRGPDWPRSHRLWWDFSVRPPRLVITKWSRSSDEIVYPVANLSIQRVQS